MTEDQSHKAFESFHRSNCIASGMDQQDIESEFYLDEAGEYIYCMAKDGWTYWQAALNFKGDSK